MRSHAPANDPQAIHTTDEGVPAPRAASRIAPAPFSRRRWYIRALLVVLAVVLATLLRVWLNRTFGLQLHYLTYFPAVFLMAQLFGTVEGLFATFAAVLIAVNPLAPGALAGLTLADKVSILILVLSGVGLSAVAGALRSRSEQLRSALGELNATRATARAELSRSHEAASRFQAVLASADEAIIGKDIHGVVTSWNNGAEAIFGYTAQEMVGQSILRIVPQGKEVDEQELLEHVARGETVQKMDVERVAKDGRTVHLNIVVSPIRDTEGNVIGASKVARDITEQLKLQRQLQQSQKMEAIGQLAGGIAHDFNNLLAIISGALELQLPLISGNEEATRRWEVASRAARRGAELTRRLLAFSSVEHFKVAPTDLNHSIRNTMEMAQRLVGPEIKMHLNLESSMGRVMVDPSGLESAVLNLVINARDAMTPKGGTLTVGTRTAELEESFTATLTGPIRAGSYACISISDTGCGMSQEVLDRACEPFFTTKDRGRGTGLGLSMVYGFVKHSGGGIRIYSEVGYGTTITFYLPFENIDRAAAIPEQTAITKPEELRRTGRILIVDDEAELLDISVTYLTARGYTVSSAQSSAEALEMLKTNGPVDVLITDIVMGGGMDGMELAGAVHGLYPQIRIIYSSGFPADALSMRSMPLADSLVLQKPYRLSELGASVDQAMGVRQVLAAAPGHSSPYSEDAVAAPAQATPSN